MEINIIALLISIVSLLVAVSAFLSTFYHFAKVRRHNEISLRPHIDFGSFYAPTSWKLTILNNGLGPAVIEEFLAYAKSSDGSLVEMTLREYIDDALDEASPQKYAGFISSGTMIASKNEILLIDVTVSPEKNQIEALNRLRVMGRIIIKYKSLYGEQFTLDSNDYPSKN